MTDSRHPLEALEERHSKLPPGGYVMLANVIDIEGGRAELAPEAVIREATAEEVEELRYLIRHYGPVGKYIPQEHAISVVNDEPGVQVLSIRQLPPGSVKYHIIEFFGGNLPSHVVEKASALTAKPFELGVNIFRGNAGAFGGGGGSGLARVAERFTYTKETWLQLDAADIADLKHVYEKLRLLKWNDEFMITIDQFLQLRAIPRSMPLRVLGCFTILESLMTHKPKPTDPNDSLTRQVVQKLALLDQRFFARKFSYPGQTKHETFWKAMYGYRSAIAHGNMKDANTPPQPLPGREAILALLEDTMAQLLRLQLDDPVLMNHLRNV